MTQHLLYFSLCIPTLQAKNTAVYRRSDKFMLALLSIDYKFLSIPLAFILLRVWSFVSDLLYLYIGIDHLAGGIHSILVILGVSKELLDFRASCIIIIRNYYALHGDHYTISVS